jgi:hypothetical protein
MFRKQKIIQKENEVDERLHQLEMEKQQHEAEKRCEFVFFFLVCSLSLCNDWLPGRRVWFSLVYGLV